MTLVSASSLERNAFPQMTKSLLIRVALAAVLAFLGAATWASSNPAALPAVAEKASAP
jgi:hypothetical protein